MEKEQLLFENIGEYVSLDGELMGAAEFARRDAAAVGGAAWGGGGSVWDAEIVYEVLRVIDGIPVFFEDHCERLACSLASVGADAVFDPAWLCRSIGRLFAANGIASGNVKIWVACGRGGMSWLLNANRSFYPPPEYYRDGVRAELMDYTRASPNVKRAVAGYKQKVKSLLDSTGAFELLLRDEGGNLTEGSRTNLFFVAGGRLFTAPDRMILKGIVKKHIVAAAVKAGIAIDETPIRADMLGGVDGAFITGTSIGALPLSHIGGMALKSAQNPIIMRIGKEYARIERDYVSAAQAKAKAKAKAAGESESEGK
ncbi:MAG: aminotransferase class IV [Clostridiales bacterium]|jgi:branched-chain amino acid aminotransferase|nr:aminotransferase class IV [Clostridiales bacterium]